MILVMDASILVKLMVPQDDSSLAEELVQRDNQWIAPDLILYETGNAMWKLCRANLVAYEDAVAGLQMMPGLFRELYRPEDFWKEAFLISTELNHPVYDCFYLALSKEKNAPLVTGDLRLINKVKNSRFENLVLTLPQVLNATS